MRSASCCCLSLLQSYYYFESLSHQGRAASFEGPDAEAEATAAVALASVFVTLNKEQYDKVFEDDPPVSFESFVGEALKFGASSKKGGSSEDESTLFQSGITLLGYFVGTIGVTIVIGFAGMLAGWPASTAISFAASLGCLKLAQHIRQKAKEEEGRDQPEWKWGVLQSLSGLYFLAGCVVVTANVWASIEGFAIASFLPSIVYGTVLYQKYGQSFVVAGINIYLLHYFFMCSLISFFVGGGEGGVNEDVVRYYCLLVSLTVQLVATYLIEKGLWTTTVTDQSRLSLLFIIEISSMVSIIPLHLILNIPSTDNVGWWAIYIVIVALYFIIAGFNTKTIVPLLVALCGVFVCIFKAYSKFSSYAPDDEAVQFALATFFLGGSAVFLVLVAPKLQKSLNAMISKLRSEAGRGKKNDVNGGSEMRGKSFEYDSKNVSNLVYGEA